MENTKLLTVGDAADIFQHILESQAFTDWHTTKFEAYITGDLPRVTEDEILHWLRKEIEYRL